MKKTFATLNQRLSLALVSICILAILGLQTIAITGLYDERLWPFLDYPMYEEPHYNGEKIDRYFLFGILDDNAVVPIQPEDLGLNFWKFLWGVVPAVIKERNEELEVYLKSYRDRGNKPVIGLRLENHPLVLSRNGVVPGSMLVVKTIPVRE